MIKVLIADDHTVVRDGLRALLEAAPEICVVGGAANGRQAVSQIQNLHPDIAIIDIQMPELNGLDVAQKILETDRETGVIILSMLGTPEHIYRALLVGARGYLLKESAGREVLEAVWAVHEGKYYLSDQVMKTLVGDYLQHRREPESAVQLEILSQREREILHWVVEGKTSAEIAEMLFLSPKTVESYRSRMMQKLDMPDLPSLVKFAVQKRLV